MNSRWSTNPIKRAGQVVSIRPNVPGDIEILKCLGRYPVLTADDLAALTQRSYGAVIARLNLLKREPSKLITVHRTQLDSPRLYQCSSQALHLTAKGIAKLEGIGFEPVHREPSMHFMHALTESQVMASFEIGARDRLVPWSEIQQSSSTPANIRETGDHSLPVSFIYRSRQSAYSLTPDGRPFAIEYPNGNYRFFVLEVDLKTEQLKWSDKDRQTIERKFIAYLSVLEAETYKTHLGFPDLTILFTTTAIARLLGMMELLASISNQYLSRFAFAVFPTIIGDTPQPIDRGWAFNQPWLQCGSKTLNIGEA
ncbi:MAG TPA: hypothetical protein VLG74_08415 [Blastocatellia bacterium]|nr:hypothetical protein [Blastocatellia bacterium]